MLKLLVQKLFAAEDLLGTQNVRRVKIAAGKCTKAFGGLHSRWPFGPLCGLHSFFAFTHCVFEFVFLVLVEDKAFISFHVTFSAFFSFILPFLV